MTVSNGVEEAAKVEYRRNADGVALVPFSHAASVLKLTEMWGKLRKDDQYAILVGRGENSALAKLWRLSAVGDVSLMERRACTKIPDLAGVLENKQGRFYLIVDGTGAQRTMAALSFTAATKGGTKGALLRPSRVKQIDPTESLIGRPPLAVLSTLDWKPGV